jgi:hypothetical protein
MTSRKQHTGFAIAIAWPETYCKQPGYWYDSLSNFIGLSDHHYYKVGHAALVLVDYETCKCRYFDFGRYHSPFQHGRVRSEATDDGLKVKTLASISEDGRKIENLEEILTELQLNPECHGEGKIHASYNRINFHRAYSKAFYLQHKSPIPYGPFRYNGSNCSRFVNSALIAGKPSWWTTFKLKYLVPLTPTPMNNVNSFENRVVLPKMLTNAPFCPTSISDKSKLKGTLPEPDRLENIPELAQWLSGEGSGSWFSIRQNEHAGYFISRFGSKGELECEGEFQISNTQSFNIRIPFQFEHLSHCRKVRIIQEKRLVEFVRILP